MTSETFMQAEDPLIEPTLARRIKFVGLDVDGVMTDGGIYLGDAGGRRVELKRYDIQDGLGIKMMQAAGVLVGILTGRVSDSVVHRAAELGVDELVQDPQARKLPALRSILARRGIPFEDAAFVGDDVPDLGVLRAVGLPVAVGNATRDAIAASKLTLRHEGGRGAVREFAELLLRARGQWEPLLEQYVASREKDAP